MALDFRTILADFPSGAEKDMLIREVGSSEAQFLELLDLALEGIDPVSWRAAWILDGSDELYPGLATTSISRIVQSLEKGIPMGTLRSLLRMLCRHEIPEDDQGLLIDYCFNCLVSELYPVAVKVHAMEIIYQHSLIYPELQEELITIIEDQIDNNSVGFLSRGRNIIKKLKAKSPK